MVTEYKHLENFFESRGLKLYCDISNDLHNYAECHKSEAQYIKKILDYICDSFIIQKDFDYIFDYGFTLDSIKEHLYFEIVAYWIHKERISEGRFLTAAEFARKYYIKICNVTDDKYNDIEPEEKAVKHFLRKYGPELSQNTDCYDLNNSADIDIEKLQIDLFSKVSIIKRTLDNQSQRIKKKAIEYKLLDFLPYYYSFIISEYNKIPYKSIINFRFYRNQDFTFSKLINFVCNCLDIQLECNEQFPNIINYILEREFAVSALTHLQYRIQLLRKDMKELNERDFKDYITKCLSDLIVTYNIPFISIRGNLIDRYFEIDRSSEEKINKWILVMNNCVDLFRLLLKYSHYILRKLYTESELIVLMKKEYPNFLNIYSKSLYRNSTNLNNEYFKLIKDFFKQ